MKEIIPDEGRKQLRGSVLPALLQSIAGVAKCLRESLSISQAGSTNTSGDSQLNVDLATNEIIHAAIKKCPSIVAASSEEDEGENLVKHEITAAGNESNENYTIAFDPLDGSSIISANFSVGTIIGIWHGDTALNRDPQKHQIASILGVIGPRTTAIVAIRLPDIERCFEVGVDDQDGTILVLREFVKFAHMSDVTTRYFAPANLRAAAHDRAYNKLVNHLIDREYTLRYSGGLVPDIVHALVKGHGVYVSPVTARSKAKLRRLYELAPVALIVECAGGCAVDPATGNTILATSIGGVDDKSGLLCGTKEEVEMALRVLNNEI